MNKLPIAELSFNADTCGAIEETRISAKIVVEVVKAAAKIISEAIR